MITGELRTNLDFHRWIMTHPKFLKGDFDTAIELLREVEGNDPGPIDHARATWIAWRPAPATG